MELIEHLENSIWNIELERALEVFSLSTYLNVIDCEVKTEIDRGPWDLNDFPEKFLHYLECKVSNPCSQTKFRLQLLILIREHLTFITTICCVTWSMSILLSTNPYLERNSAF